jgi:hypothetical protein
VVLIAKILLTFLLGVDWETLSKFYKFGNLPWERSSIGNMHFISNVGKIVFWCSPE